MILKTCLTALVLSAACIALQAELKVPVSKEARCELTSVEDGTFPRVSRLIGESKNRSRKR